MGYEHQMDLIISRHIIPFLNSLPTEFPRSRFNYNRNRMGRSSCSLQKIMSPVSTRKETPPAKARSIYPPFDADDLSRCLWWIIDNPVYWKKKNFLSVAAASPEWNGIVVWLIPLVQELMLTPTREEPDLSKWIRQIMNDSIDPPPPRDTGEAAELVGALKKRYTAGHSVSFTISPQIGYRRDVLGENTLVCDRQVWENFRSSPQKLTNDLITLASKTKGGFRITASKAPGEIRVLLDQKNRWATKIAYAPSILSVMYYGEAE